MRIALRLLIAVFPFAASAADVVPVFDDAAFRVGLTLPFVVQSVKDDPSSRIHRVSVVDTTGTGRCIAAADPKIAANFVLKCDEVAKVRLKILVARGDRATEISYGPIEIKELKAGYREPKPTGPAVDPDIAAGRTILFSKAQTPQSGGRTCVGCHSKPGLYPRIMTATAATLRSIQGNTYMPGVSNLTEAEANKVVKYLKTLTSGEEWP